MITRRALYRIAEGFVDHFLALYVEFCRYGGCCARPSATGSVQRFSCKPDSSENRHSGVYNMEMSTESTDEF
jgi:hypothetical protein